MTKQTIERLSFIASHRILGLSGQESLAIPANQYATAGKRRSVAVERIAASIAEVFEGMDEAEIAEMIDPTRRQGERVEERG